MMKELILRLLMYAAIIIAVIFGVKYCAEQNSLEKKNKIISNQNTTISLLENNNKVLDASNKLKENSELIKEKIVEHTNTQKLTNEVEHKQSSVKMDSEVTQIKENFNDKIKQTIDPIETAALVKQKETAISTLRINSLWINYCKSEPNDLDCGVVK